MDFKKHIEDIKSGKVKLNLAVIGDDYPDEEDEELEPGDFDYLDPKFFTSKSTFYLTTLEYAKNFNNCVDDVGLVHAELNKDGELDDYDDDDEEELMELMEDIEDEFLTAIDNEAKKFHSTCYTDMESHFEFCKFKGDKRTVKELLESLPFVESVTLINFKEKPVDTNTYDEDEIEKLYREYEAGVQTVAADIDRYSKKIPPLETTGVKLSDSMKNSDFADFFDEDLDDLPDLSLASTIIDKIIDRLKEAKQYIDKNQPVLAEDNASVGGNALLDLVYLLKLLNNHKNDENFEELLEQVNDIYFKNQHASGATGTKEKQALGDFPTFVDLVTARFKLNNDDDHDDEKGNPGIIVSASIITSKDPSPSSGGDNSDGGFDEEV